MYENLHNDIYGIISCFYFHFFLNIYFLNYFYGFRYIIEQLTINMTAKSSLFLFSNQSKIQDSNFQLFT